MNDRATGIGKVFCTASLACLCLLPFVTLPIPSNATEVATSSVLVQKRKRIAILDLDFASTGGMGNYIAIFGSQGPSKGVSDLLANRLVKGGAYTIVERSKIAQLLQEQGLGQAGVTDPATAAQMGRLLGAEVVIIGSITKFNLESQVSGGGLSFLGIGGSSSSARAIVKVSIRMVNTSTGEVLEVAEGSGEESQSDTNVSILGISTGASTRNTDTLLSNATEIAVDKLAKEITGLAPKLATLPPLLPLVKAVIADVTGGTITLNKGTKEGFQIGMKLSIERVIKEVKDPQTGAVLRKVAEPIGMIELTEVDAGSAVGKMIRSNKPFKVGDLAKAIE